MISRSGIEFHLELALHETGDGLFEGGDAVVGITAVLRLIDLGGHHAANVGGGHFVVFADAEIDQFPLGVLGQGLPLRPLDLLELVDLAAFAVVRAADAVGEELLEIGIAHEWSWMVPTGRVDESFILAVLKGPATGGNP